MFSFLDHLDRAVLHPGEQASCLDVLNKVGRFLCQILIPDFVDLIHSPRACVGTLGRAEARNCPSSK